mmetsp:Transcript_17645/g.60994  ORF Transcript_17645/g.60994 Transcript_17645/m.60994 type:complete len:343 (-) Transcript_17645:193-1221(-)
MVLELADAGHAALHFFFVGDLEHGQVAAASSPPVVRVVLGRLPPHGPVLDLEQEDSPPRGPVLADAGLVDRAADHVADFRALRLLHEVADGQRHAPFPPPEDHPLERREAQARHEPHLALVRRRGRRHAAEPAVVEALQRPGLAAVRGLRRRLRVLVEHLALDVAVVARPRAEQGVGRRGVDARRRRAQRADAQGRRALQRRLVDDEARRRRRAREDDVAQAAADARGPRIAAALAADEEAPDRRQRREAGAARRRRRLVAAEGVDADDRRQPALAEQRGGLRQAEEDAAPALDVAEGAQAHGRGVDARPRPADEVVLELPEARRDAVRPVDEQIARLERQR